MADPQNIALSLVQSNALLVPVVLFTVRFAFGDGSSIESRIDWDMIFVAVGALLCFGGSGLFAAIGILTLGIQDVLLFGSVIALAFGFVLYTLFVGITLSRIQY